jgi:hypothetical protein
VTLQINRIKKYLSLIALIFIGACASTKVNENSNWLASYQKVWKILSANKPYSVQVENQLIRRPNVPSLRFESRVGDIWLNDNKETYRAEISTEEFVPIRSEQWYGFSMQLPKDFPIEDNRFVPVQWWAATKKEDGESSRSPSLAVRFREGRLYVTVRHSSLRVVKDPDKVPEDTIFETKNFELGKWNDFVFQVKWVASESGYVHIWLNGKQVAIYHGPVGYRDDVGPLMKFGIYRDNSQKTYITYFSEVRRGSSYEDVAP